jgi:hypothetical protein
VARRTPRQQRSLGLWTAGWLAVLLLVGLLVAGDVQVEWPVFAVPLLWALLAVRPRRGGNGGGYGGGHRRADAPPGRAPDRTSDDTLDDGPGFWDDPPAARSPAPPTREAGVLPPPPPRSDRHRPR